MQAMRFALSCDGVRRAEQATQRTLTSCNSVIEHVMYNVAKLTHKSTDVCSLEALCGHWACASHHGMLALEGRDQIICGLQLRLNLFPKLLLLHPVFSSWFRLILLECNALSCLHA